MLTNEETELLSAYLDNELTGDELNRVNDRLAHSVDWQSAFKRLQSAKSLITAMPRLSMPADLLESLEREAQKQSLPVTPSLWEKLAAAFSFQPRWVLAGSFASVALTVVTIVGVKKMQQPAGIPLDSLLAAHTRHQMNAPLYQGVMAASDYSNGLKQSNEAKI